MPPRLPLPSAEIASVVSSGGSLPTRVSPLELALQACQSCRSFSTTSSRKGTLPAVRYRFYKWLKKDGAKLQQHRPGKQNYVGKKTGADHSSFPFPSNPFFKAQAVLSEESRDLIHRRVSMDDEPIKVVSADLGVDHRRVAAVVRMKEVEKDWETMVRLKPPCAFSAHASFLYPLFYDDYTPKIRLVLKTYNMVTKKLCEPL